MAGLLNGACGVTRAGLIGCLLLALLVGGCDSDSVTPEEQAVYEHIFRTVPADSQRPIYLAAATESAWFRENPFAESEWLDQLDDLGGIPLALVEELYRVNRDPRRIETNPAPGTVEFLPPEFADPPPDMATRGSYCLVGEGQANVDFRDGKDGYFRSYLTVSRVAFSTDRTLALLKFSRRCAPMSGGGEFFAAFKRSDDGWEGIGVLTLWIS